MKNQEYLKLEENIEHGTYLFPFIIYDTKIPHYYNKINIHWHEEIEVIIARKGKAKYMVNFSEYIVNEGDILVIMPSMLHSAHQIENEEYLGDTLVFNLNFINNSTDICFSKYFSPIISGNISKPLFIHSNQEGYNLLLNNLNNIMHYYYQKDKCFELKIKANSLLFFSNLFEYIVKEDDYKDYSNSYILYKIKSILKYINENYYTDITVDRLAEVSNMSKFYLMRTFKKYMGTTCVNYINDYRLNKAASKLITEDNSIMNISMECGFNNISYFNKLFKLKYNVTPKEYKKNYNKLT